MRFTDVSVDWYNSTFIFYLAVILLCYFIAVAGRKTVLVYGKSSGNRIQLWLLLIPFILIFLKGFGTTGRDIRGGYYYTFLSASSMESIRDNSIEIGYRILNVIVHFFSDQYWLLLMTCALLTIIPIIHLMKKYSDQIYLPAAVLLYVTCFYFDSFSLMRIAMAASFSLLSFDQIVEKKPGKALLWIILGTSFHTSVLIMIVPYFLCLAKILNRKMIGFSFFVAFFIVWVSRDSIASLLFSTSSRYSSYEASTIVEIGFQKIVYYVPLFIVFFLGKRADNNPRFARIGFIYLVISFFTAMMGYLVEIFGRMEVLALPLLIIVPYYFQKLRERYPHHRGVLNLLLIFYCIARFIIYITGYYDSSDLMPYSNIFGWVI